MDHHTGTCLLAGQLSAKADVETAWHCLWLPSALTVAEKAGDVVCAAVSSPVTSLWFLSLTHWSAVRVPVDEGAVLLVCPETSAMLNCIARRCCLLPLHLIGPFTSRLPVPSLFRGLLHVFSSMCDV